MKRDEAVGGVRLDREHPALVRGKNLGSQKNVTNAQQRVDGRKSSLYKPSPRSIRVLPLTATPKEKRRNRLTGEQE
jgi:hypothetical protein